MSLIALTILLALVTQILGLRLVASPSEKTFHCANKKIKMEEVISITYFIRGGHYLDRCNVYLYDPEENLIFNQYNESIGRFLNHKTTKSGLYKLCFRPLSKSKMNIEFAFYTHSESGELKEIAKDENLKEVSKELTSLNNIFDRMHQNVNYSSEKRNYNSKLLNNLSVSIKSLTYFKVIIIITVSLIQVYFLTKLFAGRGSGRILIPNNDLDKNKVDHSNIFL